MDSVETNRCSGCMAKRSRGTGWCPHCLNSYKNGIVQVRRADVIVNDPVFHPQYSRWKAGPGTFGPVGRLTLSAPAVLFGIQGLRVLYRARNEDAVALVIVIVVPILIVAIGFLFLVWQRDRIN